MQANNKQHANSSLVMQIQATLHAHTCIHRA